MNVFIDANYLIALFYSRYYRETGEFEGPFREMVELARRGAIKLFTSIYNFYELVQNVAESKRRSLGRDLTEQELSSVFNSCLKFTSDARLELVYEPSLDQRELLDLGWRMGFRIPGKDTLLYLSFLQVKGDFMLT